MSSSGNDPSHCDHEACKIERPHCHICDNKNCGINRPHCHVCELDEEEGSTSTRPDLARNETQPGSIKYQAKLLQQIQSAAPQSGTSKALGEDIPPQVVYHSAQWQPSYAVGGGTDLTKMLRPTAHRTFSWGGPGSNVTIPSPDHSGSSSAPESGAEDHPKRPGMPHHPRSSRMGELLRRRLEDGPIATYGLERGIGSPQSATSPLRTPPLRDRASPFMVSPVGPSPIGSSPIRRSPIVTPKIDEEEQEKENTQGKRPGLAKGLGKVRTFKELRKGKEKDK